MSQPEMIKTQLRIPADLHQRLVEFTGISGRSMNAEIVHRLEQSLDPMREPLGAMGLRARIAAERELAQSTVEMLTRAVVELETRLRTGGTGVYPRQAAGRSVEEALADSTEARDMFQRVVDAATVLLSELSIAEVKGEEPDVEEIRKRAQDWGLLK
jgi:hypothetical protein